MAKNRSGNMSRDDRYPRSLMAANLLTKFSKCGFTAGAQLSPRCRFCMTRVSLPSHAFVEASDKFANEQF